MHVLVRCQMPERTVSPALIIIDAPRIDLPCPPRFLLGGSVVSVGRGARAGRGSGASVGSPRFYPLASSRTLDADASRGREGGSGGNAELLPNDECSEHKSVDPAAEEYA
jgi:hypothetical protein